MGKIQSALKPQAAEEAPLEPLNRDISPLQINRISSLEKQTQQAFQNNGRQISGSHNAQINHFMNQLSNNQIQMPPPQVQIHSQNAAASSQNQAGSGQANPLNN